MHFVCGEYRNITFRLVKNSCIHIIVQFKNHTKIKLSFFCTKYITNMVYTLLQSITIEFYNLSIVSL